MKSTAGFLSIIFILFTVSLKAQAGFAFPFLQLNPDPESVGLGWTGVSTSTIEPLGYLSNPAILGYSSQSNNISYQAYTSKTDWSNMHDFTYNASAISAGYNFKNVMDKLNIGVGFGYANVRFNTGTGGYFSPISNQYETFYPYDKFNAYSFGASLDYFVNLSFGLNFKMIESFISENYYSGILQKTIADVDALDWGLLLNVPVSKLAIGDFAIKLDDDNKIKPIVNFSLGYSRSNIGDYVSYTDLSQKDPLPLTARLGYNLSLGADMNLKDLSLNFITFDILVEADNFLIDTDISGNPTYRKGLFGDIKFGQNLLLLKATDNVILRKAQRVTFFETFSLLYGSFFGQSWSAGGEFTDGIVISTNGWFKVLEMYFKENSYFKFFFDHLEIQYVSANTFNDDPRNTKINSVSVMFNRFAF